MKHPESMIEQFEKDTGKKFKFAENAIDRMVDKASGYEEDLIFSFAKWVTENLWGDSQNE